MNFQGPIEPATSLNRHARTLCSQSKHSLNFFMDARGHLARKFALRYPKNTSLSLSLNIFRVHSPTSVALSRKNSGRHAILSQIVFLAIQRCFIVITVSRRCKCFPFRTSPQLQEFRQNFRDLHRTESNSRHLWTDILRLSAHTLDKLLIFSLLLSLIGTETWIPQCFYQITNAVVFTRFCRFSPHFQLPNM